MKNPFRREPVAEDVPSELLKQRLKNCLSENASIQREIAIAQTQLAIAIDALHYCSIPPHRFSSDKSPQHLRAQIALAQVKEVLK